MENYDFVPVKDALLLTGIYLLASGLISLLFWLLYRDFTKANLVAFLIMAFQFFFGGFHDELRKLFPGSFVSRYTSILPAAAIFFIVIIILVKKRKRPLQKITFYLNALFVLLLLIDAGLLAGRMMARKKITDSLPPGFSACDTCRKPDIYFILADEYAGNTELKGQFHFDDSAFLNDLSRRGFHIIPDSHSNYNYTPFSLASILNMDYLDLKGKERTTPDLTYCYQSIRDNKLLQFLRFNGYRFYNYSVFDFEGQPARTRETFLPAKTRLITSQTFLSRFDRDIRFNLVTRWKSKRNQRIITYANLHNNENIYTLTWNLVGQNTHSPKFIYTHLMMPHYPYYFDRNGKEQTFEKLQEGNQVNKDAYIEYLLYSNKKLLELVDHIIKSSATPPLIVLMGDHGFRHFTEPVDSKYYFLNLESVHLPSGNYTSFRDSLNAVNLFRTILNTEFNQHLTLLKDSTSYLRD